MEEKENEIHYSFRSISSLRNLHKFFSINSSHPRNHGFTLIELLVIIAVIGVLAAATISLINPIGQTQKAADGRRKSDLKQIQSALELYRADQGTYPPVVASGNGYQSNGAANECNNGGIIFGTTVYAQKIPCDPKRSPNGEYYYVTNGSTYSITACLENSKDPDIYAANPSCDRGGYRYIVNNP